MKVHSEDLRAKIVQAVEGGMSKTRAAKTFGVSRPSVKRYVSSVREGKPLTPKRRPGSKPKLDERGRRLLEGDVELRPAVTLKERRRFVQKVVGVSVSESTLSRLLRRMGFRPKRGRWARVREEFLRAAPRGLWLAT